MSRIKVKTTFRQVVTYSKEIEMDYAEYLSWGEKIDQIGSDGRKAQADLYQHIGIDVAQDLFDSDDPEVDEFEQVS